MIMKSTQIRLVAINRGDLLLASSMDLMSYLRRSQLHNSDFSSTILEFVGRLLDSANLQNLVKNNPSLRDSAKQNRGNPPIEKTQYLQGGWLLRNARKSFGLPRSHALARNDNIFLDSSHPTLPQNDNNSAESMLDSANQTNPSLRANPQDLRGNPPCDSMSFSSGGLPRSHSLARNDENIADSANLQNLVKNNPSLRDSAKQNRGNPPIKKIQDLQGGLPREQSSLAMTKNNNFAESALDSAFLKQ